MIDVIAEMEDSVLRVRQAHLDRLHALGVRAAFIAALGAVQPPFGAGGITPGSNGLYEPGGSEPALIQPVYDAAFGLVDLVAWKSGNPAQWWLRTGLGSMLGHACPNWNNTLTVRASPLCWLRAEGDGIAILDWDSPDLEWLPSYGRLIAEDTVIARLLRKRLTRPARVPEIMIQERAFAHAA